ncbi:MAG: GNAT family N-acetyltransferase [Anaerolineales bacterium]
MHESQELLELYREDPCRTLPNAFWKSVREDGRGSRLIIQRNPADRLLALELWHGAHLMALWCEDHEIFPLTAEDISKLPFALVHDNCIAKFSDRNFSRKDAYFRLVHKGRPTESNLPLGYEFHLVDSTKEMQSVAEFINACYENINVNKEIVRSWLDHPVFDPDLWLWVIDLGTGQKAGLGVAEFDPQVREASLEWIQVYPQYQRRGLGKAIVLELLKRVSGRVLFTTVSGKVSSASHPEKLYRNCGFTGSDVWWLLNV